MRDQVHDSVVAGLTPAGRAFIDQALYLPDVWTLNPARCQTAGSGLRDQPQLVQRMLARDHRGGVLRLVRRGLRPRPRSRNAGVLS